MYLGVIDEIYKDTSSEENDKINNNNKIENKSPTITIILSLLSSFNKLYNFLNISLYSSYLLVSFDICMSAM